MATRQRVQQLEKQADQEEMESCATCGWRPHEPGDRPGCIDRHIFLDALDDDVATDAAVAAAAEEAEKPCPDCGRVATSVMVIVERVKRPIAEDELPDMPPGA